MAMNYKKDMQPQYSGEQGNITCSICCAKVRGLSKPPRNHTCVDINGRPLKLRACKECWEAWISFEIEQKPADDIQCMFCPVTLGSKEFKQIGVRVDTRHRYQQLNTNATRFKCQARCQDQNTPLQHFDHGPYNRVFTCEDCGFQTCVDCDRPEHVGETCAAYRERQLAVHGRDEAQTAAFLPSCPECQTPFSIEKGCGYAQCAPGNKMSRKGITGGCGHRFCTHCFINWHGNNSAYLGGKQQHADHCPYNDRETESNYGLKHRWLEEAGDRGQEDSGDESEDDDPGPGDDDRGTGTGQKRKKDQTDQVEKGNEGPAKKRKATAKAVQAAE